MWKVYFFVALVIIGGCSMPKYLDYAPKYTSQREGLVIVDKRPIEEKQFKEIRDSDISYYYGDNSFDLSLIEILKDRLASNVESSTVVRIEVTKITLGASINDVSFNDEAYLIGNMWSPVNSVLADITARPVLDAIESGTSLRSIWCRIDYSINGKDFSERTVNSAKSYDLAEEIVNLYVKTIDGMTKNIMSM